jgi:anti-sigma factor RsiW
VSNEIACREVLELITGYLEGALPADVHRAVEAHLSGCDGCTTVLEEFRQTIAMTGRLSEEQLSPAQRNTLLDAFRGWATA